MYPLLLGIITTFQCKLRCRHCCFGCNPDRKEFIDSSAAIEAIDVFAKFADLRCVAFTGGEPLLLHELPRLIQHAARYKVNTRVVTSAFWGTTPEAARKIILELQAAGLNELNISTGDNHAKYVKIENIVNAAIESAKAGLHTLIVVEHHKNAGINKETVLAMIREKKGPFQPAHPIVIIENEIVPLQVAPSCALSEIPDRNSPECLPGCNNILLNISLLPTGELYACCGLTMLKIPELKMGNAKDLYQLKSREEFANLIYKNFLWLWLSVEGPERMAQIVEDEVGIKVLDADMKHRCHQCLALFSNRLARQVLLNRANDIRDGMIMKFLQQQTFFSEMIS